MAMYYNEENRLAKLIMADGTPIHYQYDSNGQRVRKVKEGSSYRHITIYIGQWEIYRKIDSFTPVIILERETLHIMDDTARVAVIDTPTIDTLSTGEVQTLRYQLSNHIGTASLELADDADVISYEEYYPFGNTSYQGGRSAAECSLKRYRYVGKERDDESGFIYIGARYYCPWLARWLAPDPINNEWYNLCKGEPQRSQERDFLEFTASSYEYCYANPVRFIDPTGEQPKIGYVSQQLAPNSHLPAHNGTYGGPTLADVTEAKIKKHSPVAAGIYKGTNNFIMHTFEGAVQTVVHPIETAKAVGKTVAAFLPGVGFSPQGAQTRAQVYDAVNNAVNKFKTGDVATKTAMITEGVLTVGTLFVGLGEAKGTATVGEMGEVASTGLIDVTGAETVAHYNLLKSKFMDCSDMASDIQRSIGGDILELTPIREKSINGIEYGEPAQWNFHEVVQKDGYIYDPMFGSKPVKTEDFMQQYKEMNPGGFSVTNKTQ